MENYDISTLREWAPLTEVLDKIPSRIQKGLFSNDLNITCIDVIPEFIAFGTDAGIVFWYNRYSGDVQKLRAEVTSSLTCIKIVSSVEYMVAAGSTNGQVSIFQIQKDIPQDLSLIVPLVKSKPIERYTIRDLHKSTVTCCEWSKNGMRLYSGDKQGVVVQTEFDYQAHLSKSTEILNEAYGIVQLNVYQSYLIVSTIYRSIICKREQQQQQQKQQPSNNSKWKIIQIGKKDRKILHEFGAAFRDTTIINNTTNSPQIVCSRPGLRLWLSDINGNVEKTLIYKNTITSKPLWNIPLLNPIKNVVPKPLINFSKILMYTKEYVITYDDTLLVILNIEKLCIEAIAQGFRSILNVSICGKEIFILEGTRSVIRISTCPEPPNKTAKIIFNPLLPPPIPTLNFTRLETPIEFETEDDVIINAEECFELPPIEQIDLDIPIQTEMLNYGQDHDSPTTQKNKLVIEQNRRIEIFDKINEMKFDDSILYRSGVGKKHRKHSRTDNEGIHKRKSKNGIVEIGQTAKELNESVSSSMLSSSSSVATEDDAIVPESTINDKKTELTTKPLLMAASFCNDHGIVPDLRSPDTIKRVLESKEKALAEVLDLEPVKLVEISEDDLKKATEEIEKSSMGSATKLPILQYPINYPFTTIIDNSEVQTTPRKKLHFITENDSVENLKDEIDGAECCSGTVLSVDATTSTRKNQNNKLYTADEMNLCENFDRNIMIQSDCTNNTSVHDILTDNDKMIKSLQFVKCNLNDDDIPSNVPDIKQFPEFMKIPSLWNEKIERIDCVNNTNSDEHEQSDSQTSGDWEFVD